MKIVSIRFVNGKIIASPDPVIIKLGEQIEWNVATLVQETTTFVGTKVRRILILGLVVKIYFTTNGSPFQSNSQVIQAGGQIGSISGSGISEPAITKGEFKYGINIRESHSGEFLEDEDPKIIVV